VSTFGIPLNPWPTEERPDAPLAGLRFAIVGAGRLGSSLALAMSAKGGELVGYVCLTPAGRCRAHEWLRSPAAAGLGDLVSSRPDLYVISVPDSVLPGVATDLAAGIRPQAGDGSPVTDSGVAPVILHTSGASSIDVLHPCADAGATTLAFHPLQTFSEPLTGSKRFAGAAVAVTPAAGPACSVGLDAGFSLARALDAYPFLLADEKRVIYTPRPVWPQTISSPWKAAPSVSLWKRACPSTRPSCFSSPWRARPWTISPIRARWARSPALSAGAT
jgi:predicted short-subunit dehydrogenase-like oxidoreductase (DUF2520 family)